MEQKKKPTKKPNSLNKFARLSGVAIQMGVIIFLGAYSGKLLDEKYPLNKKWFTIGLTLLGVIIALYTVLKQVNKINQEEDEEKQ
ncbi:MAG: AtpZ/AtpI family protein [Vicingaceae bacterium]|nr:AtpZ/AtpI family protein [Vicingaceae bacterium]